MINNSNISFTSKIKVVKVPMFHINSLRKRCLKSNCYTGDSWEIDCHTLGKQAFSDGASICTIAAIKNDKEVFMFHAVPAVVCSCQEKLMNLFAHMYKKLNASKAKGTDVRGFLAGGSVDDTYSQKAHDIYKNIYEKLNIKFSELWGQDMSATSVFYSAAKDTWEVFLTGGDNRADWISKSYRDMNILQEDELLENKITGILGRLL